MTLTCDDVRDLAPAYVLGALERAEELAVAEHLAGHADAHAEMTELGGVVPYLGQTVPLVEPPASLRERVLSAAAADLGARHVPGTAAQAPATSVVQAEPEAGRAGRVISIDAARERRRPLRAWALGIAAVIAIVALGAWNVLVTQDLSNARAYQARLADAVALAGQPGSQVAVLTSAAGPGPGPGGIAVMPASGNGRLLLSGLAPTSGGHVYEAWTIVAGQPPTPVGSFTVGSDGLGYFDRMPGASGQPVTVAVTLEARPDPPAPTTPILSVGIAAPPTPNS